MALASLARDSRLAMLLETRLCQRLYHSLSKFPVNFPYPIAIERKGFLDRLVVVCDGFVKNVKEFFEFFGGEERQNESVGKLDRTDYAQYSENESYDVIRRRHDTKVDYQKLDKTEY